MKTREFGRTGLRVTPLGLGLAALGRPGYITLGHAADLDHNYDEAAMEARAHAMLDTAWTAGIRYFDTARSYGRGESFLGSWLRKREVEPAAVTIGSKWGYTYTAGWQVDADVHEVKEHTLPVLQRQTGESQANLGPYLKIYHIHSATLSSGVLDRPEVLDELARLKAESGLIVGLSLSGVGQGETLEKALTIYRDGIHLFGSVQATWNVLEPSCGPLLEEASTAGWGVIVKEAVANGRLTPRAEEQPLPLQELAQKYKTDVDALAIAAVLAQPWVSVVLSGAVVPAHLESNLKALDLAEYEELQTLHTQLAEPPQRYWQTRSNLAWN